ncbi:MAG: precorrin-6y C5,15-methyltransferase (decarboxylating) subunit CbiE [Chloroflexi bacterium]|nr:precorrin-6y C5,15-methyltransferase (decarboxylating) subunit CbiE [Chloroflexota bacterium]
MSEPVVVIGVGVDGLDSLTPQAKNYIAQADQLWGSERLLGLFPNDKKVILSKGIAAALETLKRRGEGERIVLLASGDPGFFGLGGSVLKVLPPDEVELIPQVSVLQAAFARAKVAWRDAHFTSAHARPLAEVVGLAKRFPKLGVLTDPRNTPALIAEKLLAAGIPDCRAVVFENLGEADEAMSDSSLSALIGKSFADLNVLLLLQPDGWQPAPFLIRPDSAYAHRNELITKADIRALCLSRLALRETDVIWDIGAGSGSVSVEMAEQAWRGRVFAVERDSENLAHIRENIARFGILNVEVVSGEAPAALAGLPAPNAVFIGGSGGQLEAILETVSQFAGCRVVATFAVLENMLAAFQWMKNAGWTPSLTQAQLSSGSSIAEGTRLLPSNPVFILSAIRF